MGEPSVSDWSSVPALRGDGKHVVPGVMVPSGTTDNSPAIHRWDHDIQENPSRQGRKNGSTPAARKPPERSTVPDGTGQDRGPEPSDKSLGYFRIVPDGTTRPCYLRTIRMSPFSDVARGGIPLRNADCGMRIRRRETAGRTPRSKLLRAGKSRERSL